MCGGGGGGGRLGSAPPLPNSGLAVFEDILAAVAVVMEESGGGGDWGGALGPSSKMFVYLQQHGHREARWKTERLEKYSDTSYCSIFTNELETDGRG